MRYKGPDWGIGVRFSSRQEFRNGVDFAGAGSCSRAVRYRFDGPFSRGVLEGDLMGAVIGYVDGKKEKIRKRGKPSAHPVHTQCRQGWGSGLRWIDVDAAGVAEKVRDCHVRSGVRPNGGKPELLLLLLRTTAAAPKVQVRVVNRAGKASEQSWRDVEAVGKGNAEGKAHGLLVTVRWR
ncbi:hypothetical protein V8E51_006802 [Hyaloscypha variabilis]